MHLEPSFWLFGYVWFWLSGKKVMKNQKKGGCVFLLNISACVYSVNEKIHKIMYLEMWLHLERMRLREFVFSICERQKRQAERSWNYSIFSVLYSKYMIFEGVNEKYISYSFVTISFSVQSNTLQWLHEVAVLWKKFQM